VASWVGDIDGGTLGGRDQWREEREAVGGELMKEPTEEEMKEVMGGKWRNDFTCVNDTAGPPLASPPFVASGASATAPMHREWP
jgi:hypothetical protein